MKLRRIIGLRPIRKDQITLMRVRLTRSASEYIKRRAYEMGMSHVDLAGIILEQWVRKESDGEDESSETE